MYSLLKQILVITSHLLRSNILTAMSSPFLLCVIHQTVTLLSRQVTAFYISYNKMYFINYYIFFLQIYCYYRDSIS